MKRPSVLILGPSREAISGVSTHVNALLGSSLTERFGLRHFQVGSEGRAESALARALRLLASPLQLFSTLVRRNVDVVHVNTSLNAKAFWRDLAYVATAKLAGARVLYQVHGGALARFAAGHPAFKAFLRAALRLPDVVAVLSNAELQAWRELLPSQPVAPVPNGVDCALYRRYNRRAPDPRAPLRIVYVGRLARAKGLEESIEALRLARAPSVLVIAGGGPLEGELRRRVREAGLESRVSFAGPTHGQHKARLLARADAFVLASHSEGMPYSLLEAMAAGVVPVVTPVGGMPEVVSDGEHGLCVPVGEPQALAAAIDRLAGDRRELARMSAACRKRIVSAYSIERAARDFAALYGALCDRRAPRAVL